MSICAHRAMFIRNRETLDYLTKIREGRKAMLSIEVDLKTLFCIFFASYTPVLFSAQSHVSYAIYNAIPIPFNSFSYEHHDVKSHLHLSWCHLYFFAAVRRFLNTFFSY